MLKSRAGSRARALAAFHAVDGHVATYDEVGKTFNLSGAALHDAVRRYRNVPQHAHLFRTNALIDELLQSMPRAMPLRKTNGGHRPMSELEFFVYAKW